MLARGPGPARRISRGRAARVISEQTHTDPVPLDGPRAPVIVARPAKLILQARDFDATHFQSRSRLGVRH